MKFFFGRVTERKGSRGRDLRGFGRVTERSDNVRIERDLDLTNARIRGS